MFETLKSQVRQLGKPQWRPMLQFVADMHETCVHPAEPPFDYPWEEIGPGYCYAPVFGHWDLIQQLMDSLPTDPQHTEQQIMNNLACQQPDGLVPGGIWMGDIEGPFMPDADPTGLTKARFRTDIAHAPVWVIAVQEHARITGSNGLIRRCYEPLLRQIGWFEKHRQHPLGGFHLIDFLHKGWEGIDEGIRFIEKLDPVPGPCPDASAWVWGLYDHAARWSRMLGKDASTFERKRAALGGLIQDRLFDDETGFYHDAWTVGDAAVRCFALENMWPIVVGAATAEHARRVIDENLLDPRRFYSAHPLTSVSMDDPRFELRCWRGPAWNGMTFWAARACLHHYDRPEAARRMLEPALDVTARVFDETGTVWEFYHPHGGSQDQVQRKPSTPFNQPCRDYLGHNPVIAMARMWEACRAADGS